MTLIDTNILIDIAKPDEKWRAWSMTSLARAVRSEGAFINPIIYSELAAAYESSSVLDEMLECFGISRLELSFEAAFLAGERYADYRRRGGPRERILSDFYIGAHAEFSNLVVLTRDVARFRTNFPTVQLICPPNA